MCSEQRFLQAQHVLHLLLQELPRLHQMMLKRLVLLPSMHQQKLKQLVRMYRQKAAYNSDMASRLQAAVTRLRKFEDEGQPELAPREQNVRMRLRGGRTGKRAAYVWQNLRPTKERV